jgi:hypothetical protein
VSPSRLFFSLWLMVGLVAHLGVIGAEARLVAVVYDDSGSMSKPPEKWWQANYAMQTLTALLNPSDTLAVVFMSNPTQASSWPDKPRAIQTLQQQAPPRSQTPFQAVETAMRAVEASNEEDRWLIIITDGGFQDYPQAADLQARIKNFAGATGARTVFLLIGGDVSDDLATFWDKIATAQIYRAAAVHDIAPRLQEIAALVNGRPPSPGQLQLAMRGNQVTLTTELPLKRLTLFQQEEAQAALAVVREATVGAEPLRHTSLLTRMPQRAQISKFAHITHFTHPKSEQVIPEGILTIGLERPVALSRLTFFPEVAARFVLSLEQADGSPLTPTPQNIHEVCLGKSFRVVAHLLDPHSHQPLSATIKHPEKIAVTVTYQQKDYPLTLEPQRRFFVGLLPAVAGQEPLSATAAFPGYFHFKSKVFIIEGIPCCRQLALEPVAPWSAKVTELDQAPPLRLLPTVNGQAVPPSEFQTWTLKILKEPPVGLQIEKQADHWLLRPQGHWCSPCFTATGTFPLEVEISSSHPGETIRAPLEVTIANVSLWQKCGRLMLLLLLIIVMTWYIIGLSRKARFAAGSAIIYRTKTRTHASRPFTYSLPTSLWQRWLVPYRDERRLVEGILFIAAKRSNYVYIAQESLTPQMAIDGLPVMEPGQAYPPSKPKRLDNNSELTVQEPHRTEYYVYSSGK